MKQDFTEKLDWFNDDTATDLDLIYVVDYDDKRKRYTPKKKKLSSVGPPARTQETGVIIGFISEKVYNTATTPGTGNIAMKPQLAKLGIVQKIYHNDVTPPVFSGVADIQIMGTGVYVPGVLNIIYAEWTGPTESRIEYWITQEG
jgi:hypothetical protein